MKSIFCVVSVCLALSATPSHAAVDVCKLLTVDQVQAATQMKVLPAFPQRTNGAMIGKCLFAHADKGDGKLSVLAISVYKPEEVETYKQSWAHPMALKYEPVSGVGDYAYFRANPRVLEAGIGNSKAVSVQLLDGPEREASLEILKALAREALAKL